MAVGALAGCSQGQTGQYKNNTTGKQVSVMYAGSMTKIMEDKIKPDFDKRTDAQFEGEGKGSNALAQMIKSGLSNPDVFISASPDVNTSLLMGNKNHNLENWYITLASDQLVIAYSPKSRFKADFDAAKKDSKPWYEVLQMNGLHFGRTDPELDPKGVNTLFMFQLAQNYYHKPGLSQAILKSAENTDQVFPEETLVTQLESGQTDAIIAYKHEAIEWGMPFISLPDAINLGSEKYAKEYHQATYTQKNGQVVKGSPILFTATILNHAKNPEGAARFLQYLVSGNGAKLLLADGFTKTPLLLYGRIQNVPKELTPVIKGAFSG